MEQEREAQAGEKHTFECGGCGASLTFAPGTTSLACEYCGHEQEIGPGGGDAVEREITEYDFAEGLARARRTKAKDLVQGGKEVQCNGCGARTVLTDQSGNCPYCDSPMVVDVKDEQSDDMIIPESVLPFKVEDRAARDKFYEWVASLWFAPSDLKNRAQAERLDGVYMPYWTYDSNTTTRYRGERGEHYYDTEHYTDSEGNRKTRQVRKTRWYSASGTVRVDFDDVLIYASKSLPRKLIRKLEPWDLHDLKPYDPAYLSGFVAERYTVDLQAGFKLAEDRMEPKIRTTIRHDIGGDEQRIHWMNIRHDNVKWKHFLLPLWISAYRYNEQVYRFMVNARTGEVAGERPWSWIKITLAVLAVIAVIVGIVFAVQAGQAPR